MVVFLFFYLKFLGELGFLFLFSGFFLFLIINFFDGLSVSINITMDFISFGMLTLSLLVLISMLFAGSYEHYSYSKWEKVVFLLFLLFLFLTYTFSLSSFLLFYLFFEFVIIPTFILILGWGYSLNRIQAALYMFMYTLLSSLPLLILLVLVYLDGVSLFFLFNFFCSCGGVFFYWWFLIVMVFMVKLPLFILHLWLPKAHVDAPLLGSMILAGVLLKMGGYGIYKSLPFVFLFYGGFSSMLSSFSLYGGVFAALLCLRQTDVSSLIAYSSVVHMGPVFCSLILVMYPGVLGSYWMMISHGFCSACLFYLVNLSFLMMGSRGMFFMRGGVFFYPFFSFFWFFFCLSNMGFPPTFNFFSEVFLMLGVFPYSFLLMILVFFLMFLSGFYSVIIFCFFNHGFDKYQFFNFKSLTVKDLMVLMVFLFFLLFFMFFSFVLC